MNLCLGKLSLVKPPDTATYQAIFSDLRILLTCAGTDAVTDPACVQLQTIYRLSSMADDTFYCSKGFLPGTIGSACGETAGALTATG